MLKAISNIVLAIVVLVSSTGIVLSEHYCMDQRQASGLYGIVHQCGMETEAPCSSHEGEESKSCCNNESQYIDGIDLEVSVISALELPVKFDVLIAALPLNYTIHHITQLSAINYINFHPPPTLQDIPVLLQSLLF